MAETGGIELAREQGIGPAMAEAPKALVDVPTAQEEPSVVSFSPVRRSPTIGKLVLAVSKAQGAITPASKDSKNPFFKNVYASLTSVWESIRKPLADQELAVFQPVTTSGRHVQVTTLLAHSSDEWIEQDLTMRAAQETAQAIGGTITYARRYALSALVGATAEDDDGTSASTTLPAGMSHAGASSKPTEANKQPLREPSVGVPAVQAVQELAEARRNHPASASMGVAPVSVTNTGGVVAPPPGKPPARAPGTGGGA